MRSCFTSFLCVVCCLSAFPAEKAGRLQNELNTGNNLYLLLVCLLVLILLVMAAAFVLFIRPVYLKKIRLMDEIIEKQREDLALISGKLNNNTCFKEEYIGYCFSLISGYLRKIEKIQRSVERKIRVKKYDDILLSFNEINIKEERESMFNTFDTAFLKIFPDFISVFNSLLRKEDQVWPPKNTVLTTDLRIFALMRLGIRDCETIAGILEYSASTIYVYKMRLRARAIVPGDQFEQAIMSIKTVTYTDHLEYRKSA